MRSRSSRNRNSHLRSGSGRNAWSARRPTSARRGGWSSAPSPLSCAVPPKRCASGCGRSSRALSAGSTGRNLSLTLGSSPRVPIMQPTASGVERGGVSDDLFMVKELDPVGKSGMNARACGAVGERNATAERCAWRSGQCHRTASRAVALRVRCSSRPAPELAADSSRVRGACSLQHRKKPRLFAPPRENDQQTRRHC